MPTTFLLGQKRYRIKQLRDDLCLLNKRHDDKLTHTIDLSDHQLIQDGLTLSSVAKEDFGTTTTSVTNTTTAFTFTVQYTGEVKFTLTFSNSNTLQVRLIVDDITNPRKASDYD